MKDVEIDPFTFVAQLVNFLIIVVVLKKTLFGRVLAAMDGRAERTRSAFERAERARKEADDLASAMVAERAAIESDRDTVLRDARAKAESERKALLLEARGRGEAELATWREGMAAERDEFLESLRRRGGAYLMTLARKALSDLGDEELEGGMARVLASRIEAFDEDRAADLRSALAESAAGDGPVLLRSAFPLSEASERLIAAALRARVGWSGRIVNETRQGSAGIEIEAGGCRVSWGFEEYVDSLDDRLRAVLEGRG